MNPVNSAEAIAERSAIGGIIIFASIIFSYSLWFPRAAVINMGGVADYEQMYFAIGAPGFQVHAFGHGVVVLHWREGRYHRLLTVKRLVRGHMLVGYIFGNDDQSSSADMHGLFGVYELPGLRQHCAQLLRVHRAGECL